jgi:hypothetical protein
MDPSPITTAAEEILDSVSQLNALDLCDNVTVNIPIESLCFLYASVTVYQSDILKEARHMMSCFVDD